MDESQFFKTVSDIVATRDAVVQALEEQDKTKKKKPEFSKVTVILLIGIWSAIAIYCAVVWLMTGGLMPTEILGYITGIVATALGGYYAKTGYFNSKRQTSTDELTAKALTIVKAGGQSNSKQAGQMEAGENI